jgi:hypothetical protein
MAVIYSCSKVPPLTRPCSWLLVARETQGKSSDWSVQTLPGPSTLSRAPGPRGSVLESPCSVIVFDNVRGVITYRINISASTKIGEFVIFSKII